MKRILGLSALMGQLFASAVATGAGAVQPPQYKRQYGPMRTYRAGYISAAKPTDARWWHDSKSLQQHPTILNALDKRQRRAEKLQRDMAASTNGNWAHGIGKRGVHLSPVPQLSGRLNPFYVAK